MNDHRDLNITPSTSWRDIVVIETRGGARVEVEEIAHVCCEGRDVMISFDQLGYILDVDHARALVHALVSVISEDDAAAVAAWELAKPARALRVVE